MVSLFTCDQLNAIDDNTALELCVLTCFLYQSGIVLHYRESAIPTLYSCDHCTVLIIVQSLKLLCVSLTNISNVIKLLNCKS